MSEAIDYRRLLLELLSSLSLCDHMGDVADDVDYVLKKLGIEETPHLEEVGRFLETEYGITTLYGTAFED